MNLTYRDYFHIAVFTILAIALMLADAWAMTR